MPKFKTRINQIAKKNSKLILANDYDFTEKNIKSKTLSNISLLKNHICGLKLNFHLLLPLSSKEILSITKTAHKHGIQTIADIKLNDIGNTNRVTTERLWELGFDAVIVNPIMGIDSLKNLVNFAHKKNKGVITLCHMSAPEARMSYEMKVFHNRKSRQLYKIFLEWALSTKADGIIAGATYPEIIRYCKKTAKKKLDIFSPGIGTQGGKVSEIISSGTDYLIVGRTILNSKDPLRVAEEIKSQSLLK